MENINQGFSFSGSSNYNFKNVSLQETGIALFDTLTGIGGIDYIPADGDLVTVVAGFDSNDYNAVRQFDPSMNNKVYYLVTDIDYESSDRDIIISLATEIPVVYNISLGYVGDFVFNNPNDYPNLYLIWDYTDKLDIGSISYSGKKTERIIEVEYSTDKGIAGFDYVTDSSPIRYQLRWNNATVGDTGYVGLNSSSNYNELIDAGVDPKDIKLSYPYDGLVNNGTGQIRFNKFSESKKASLYVSAPINNSGFTITNVEPTLKPFFINTTDGDLSNVCSQIPNGEYYHDGINLLPTNGDRIYEISEAGTILYNGNNAYHQINTTDSYAGIYALVGEDGIVANIGNCNCEETEVPTITEASFVFVLGQSVNVKLEATNNPTSWNIITSCDEYILNGGTTGTVFNYTDCNSNSKNVTVNIGQTEIICSSAAPTIVGGDGSYLLNGPCLSYVLPKGLSFDTINGTISGVVNDDCEFSFDVEATNCFGTSLAETITISIVSAKNYKPFLIDVENFGNTSAEACAITSPLYSVLYQNGAGDTPVVGDYIIRTYTNQASAESFFGGGKWYVVYGTSDVIKICETGKVCDIYTCP